MIKLTTPTLSYLDLIFTYGFFKIMQIIWTPVLLVVLGFFIKHKLTDK